MAMTDERAKESLEVLGVAVIDGWDTISAAIVRQEWTADYVKGKHDPHFPMPAMLGRVDMDKDFISIDYTNMPVARVWTGPNYWD